MISSQLKQEYLALFAALEVRSSRQDDVDFVLDRIIKNRPRYEATSGKSGVPWYVIAAIHSLEASLNFSRHLHNGDPLTARTVHVPADRPKTGNPPFSWEDSAADALELDGATSVSNWTLPDILDFLERFNGLGYRNGSGQATTPPRRSPYLWSFSNHYERGKYVADGHFSPTAVSEQVGAAVILKELERRGAIKLDAQVASPAVGQELQMPEFEGEILKMGSKGDQVRIVQEALNKLGFGPLKVDGKFGEMTEGAVLAFQRSQQIERTAKVGPTTWSAMRALLLPNAPKAPSTATVAPVHKLELSPGEILEVGSTGEHVQAVEEALQMLGFSIKADGIYDSDTEGAVKLFQKVHSVGQTGKVGTQTLGALQMAVHAKLGQNSSIHRKLFDFYSTESGYASVMASVATFYPPVRKNGCVAFMSTALRKVGVPVPFDTDDEGLSISLVTRPFSDWLKSQGWRVILNHEELMPGDVCFTVDAPGDPGFPAHTYMLHSWIGEDHVNGLVVDNQAFTHPRNIHAFGSFNFSPFAYALRSPV